MSEETVSEGTVGDGTVGERVSSGGRPSDDLRDALRAAARRRIQQSIDVPTVFFASRADEVARACLQMARRFDRGGRLLPFGVGGCASDAAHVSVEFVHPVIVGKRALPAIGLTHDVATVTGTAARRGDPAIFADQIRTLARQQDIALGISPDGDCPSVLRGLRAAGERGLLTLALAGGDGGAMERQGVADFCFTVPAADPGVVQEVHETLYHVLWELVHVFFEHGSLLR